VPDAQLDSNANFLFTFVHDSREIMGWKCRRYLTFVPDLTPSSSSGTTSTFIVLYKGTRLKNTRSPNSVTSDFYHEPVVKR